MDTPSWNCEQLNVTKGVENTNIFIISVGCTMYEYLGIFQEENWSLFWCFRFQRAQGFSERIIEKWEIARKLRSVSRRWGYLWDRKIRIRRHADSGEESEGQCHAAGMHAYCPQPHCCSGAQQHLTAAPRPLCPSVTEGCSQIGKKQKQKQTVNKM